MLISDWLQDIYSAMVIYIYMLKYIQISKMSYVWGNLHSPSDLQSWLAIAGSELTISFHKFAPRYENDRNLLVVFRHFGCTSIAVRRSRDKQLDLKTSWRQFAFIPRRDWYTSVCGVMKFWSHWCFDYSSYDCSHILWIIRSDCSCIFSSL